MGTCEAVPDVCPEYYGPVCGCDGQTYDNACFAHGAGVSVAQEGVCGSTGTVCGGFAGIPCPMGEFCDFTLEAMCGAADQTGTCEPIPEACATIYAPVCGCDGVTYGNACEANGAGIAVATQGECGGSAGVDCGGFAGLLCPNGELCDFTLEAMCGAADQMGTCKPIPDACDTMYAPVCGCDGVTYGNTCEANAAGVAIVATGACK